MSDQTLQGWVPELADPAELFDALNKAFDYRGDVTLTLDDGSEVTGYIFDRRVGKGLDDSTVRLIPADADDRVEIAYARIRKLAFSGRDTAAGKSWETWVKKYIEKKTRGEKAEIHGDHNWE